MLQRNSGAPPLLCVCEAPASGSEHRITEEEQSSVHGLVALRGKWCKRARDRATSEAPALGIK